jgi:hypothetical protein
MRFFGEFIHRQPAGVTQTERVTRCSCALFCIRQYRTHSIVAGVSAGNKNGHAVLCRFF